MFRRKEESATDFSTENSGMQANGAAHAHQESTVPVVNTATAGVPTSLPSITNHSAYAPIASTHRAASEPARAAMPSSPVASYRPTAVAEFNRPTATAARAAEPARPTPASTLQPTTSFAASPEKSASIKPNRRVLTVGNDILLKGEIATCDRLVIEGRVEAKLSDVHTVEIAECGSFKGTAEVEDAEISGIFEGDLVVRNRLVIYATGEVRGNIGYGEIEIERGGKLTGQIKTVPAATAAAPKVKSLDLTSLDATKAPAATRTKETVAA